MYRLHCSKCDNVIEFNENFFKIHYTEIFGTGGGIPAVPRHCELCPSCFNEFKRSIDWELDNNDFNINQ